ncbi:MAG: HAD family hydrolase [Bacilli bacterium]|nr:HAD family hydrolase [Bacilli bacterium]
MYKNVFFDLDGTLLMTIHDIAIAINEALASAGLPYHYQDEEVVRFIGNGARVLVKKALREKGDDEAILNKVESLYMPLYRKYQNDHAKPFDGMVETLVELKHSGVRLFVVTNKPHELADFIVHDHFDDLFLEVLGAKEGTPLKPNPYQVNELVDKYGLNRNESLYVGDSYVDIDTGDNAGMDVVLCGYGYGVYDESNVARAKFFIGKPAELKAIVLG